MIQTKEDYKEYRRMDDARYVKSKYPFLLWLMGEMRILIFVRLCVR